MQRSLLAFVTFATILISIICSCSDNDSVSNNEIANNFIPNDNQLENIYNENQLLRWKYTPPATNQWYEYDDEGRKIFGAGCHNDTCHHYIYRYKEGNVLEARYSDEYVCDDFKDLTYPIQQSLALYFFCKETELLEKPSFMWTYRLDTNNTILKADSVLIDFFNAEERFADMVRD